MIASVARLMPQRGGLDGSVAVVVRHKHDRAFARVLASALLPLCRRSGALIFAHDDAAAVSALGLDGVHLSSTASPRLARLRLPRGRLVGQSRHRGDPVDAACDYVTLSPIFHPHSKPDDERDVLGVAALGAAAVPVFALGGVDDNNARACVEHGAAGVAVIDAVFGAVDPAAALDRLLRAVA